MKIKEFNQLKREVKEGNVKGLKKDVIKELTLNQAQAIENLMLDLELNEEKNKVLDEIVNRINDLVEKGKVANKKLLKTEKPEKEKPEKPEKEKPEKPEKEKPEKPDKPFNKVNVGDTVYFRVEGEEIKHSIKIIYKGRKNVIGIMTDDEDEVFKIRKQDFNKQVFEWTDRKGETYNIIATI
jgi:transcription elongation GreA/GreB family factor